ncbi:hypothetical protein AMTRI_Chr10g1360 [Amborella trichopoda]
MSVDSSFVDRIDLAQGKIHNVMDVMGFPFFGPKGLFNEFFKTKTPAKFRASRKGKRELDNLVCDINLDRAASLPLSPPALGVILQGSLVRRSLRISALIRLP